LDSQITFFYQIRNLSNYIFYWKLWPFYCLPNLTLQDYFISSHSISQFFGKLFIWWTNFLKPHLLSSLYIKMGIEMFDCLSVSMLRAFEIQTPVPMGMKFCTHIPTCPRKVLVQVWPPPPLRPWDWGSWNTKSWRTHF